MRQTIRRLRSDEAGYVAILAVICLPILAVAVGFAVDQSTLLRTHDDLQHLADAAALAGARAMGAQERASREQREEAAVAVATNFIEVRSDAAAFSISPSAAAATVSVSLSLDQAVAFGVLFGQSRRKVGAESTATYMVDKPSGCLIALDASEVSGIEAQGAAGVSAPRCGIWSNADGPSSIRMQGAPAVLGETVCADGASGNAVDNISPELSEDCGKAADPYSGRLDSIATGCNYAGSDFSRMAKDAAPEPGVYCGGVAINGFEVSLKPGLYVIKDGPLVIDNNSRLVGEGVSIVLTGADAALKMQGSADMALTAPTGGDLVGIALAVTDTGREAAESELQGSPTLRVDGSIYMAGQRLLLQGNPQLLVRGEASKAIARSFAFKGSPDISVEALDTVVRAADISYLRVLR